MSAGLRSLTGFTVLGPSRRLPQRSVHVGYEQESEACREMGAFLLLSLRTISPPLLERGFLNHLPLSLQHMNSAAHMECLRLWLEDRK